MHTHIVHTQSVDRYVYVAVHSLAFTCASEHKHFVRDISTHTRTHSPLCAGMCISSQHAWLAHSQRSRQSSCPPMHDSEIHTLCHTDTHTHTPTHIVSRTNATICVYKRKTLSHIITIALTVTEMPLFSAHKYTQMHMIVHVNEKHIVPEWHSHEHKYNILM